MELVRASVSSAPGGSLPSIATFDMTSATAESATSAGTSRSTSSRPGPRRRVRDGRGRSGPPARPQDLSQPGLRVSAQHLTEHRKAGPVRMISRRERVPHAYEGPGGPGDVHDQALRPAGPGDRGLEVPAPRRRRIVRPRRPPGEVGLEAIRHIVGIDVARHQEQGALRLEDPSVVVPQVRRRQVTHLLRALQEPIWMRSIDRLPERARGHGPRFRPSGLERDEALPAHPLELGLRKGRVQDHVGQ